MRIRTDGDFSHRERHIKDVSEFYDCNKTKALMNAGEDVQAVHEAVEAFLQRDDIPATAKRKLVDELENHPLLSWGLSFDVSVNVNPEG